MGEYATLYNLDRLEGVRLPDFTWFYHEDLPTPIMHEVLLNKSDAVGWAGDRIICMSEHAHSGIPKGLFSDIESYNLKLGECPDPYKMIARACNDWGGRVRLKNARYYKEYDYTRYVLRNFSKKEYIRGDHVTGSRKGYSSLGQLFFGCISFGTRWVINEEKAESHDFSNGRYGRWAGDRFDLVLYEDVMDALECDGWRNISEDVKKFDEEVYRVYGD